MASPPSEEPPQPQAEADPTPAPACPGCQGPEPLLLPCGHSLCQDCLSLCQGELGQEQSGCTECYGKELLSTVLRGLLDSLFQGQARRPRPLRADGDWGVEGGEEGQEEEEKAWEVCEEHGHRMELYCTEDEELVCEECARDEHLDHLTCSTGEALEDCKVCVYVCMLSSVCVCVCERERESVNIANKMMSHFCAEHVTQQILFW